MKKVILFFSEWWPYIGLILEVALLIYLSKTL
jgi:hypothetical protein